MIAVVDYKCGNICSVEKAFRYLGAEVLVTSNPKEIRRAEKIVLPGVGAFGDAERSFESLNLKQILQDEMKSGKPFFGICLGMQLLYEASEESPGAAGLGLLQGTVKKFPPKDKVPHTGWNDLKQVNGSLFEEGSYVYFVHSFFAELSEYTVAECDYAGVRFSAAVQKGNVFGAQFHPEKSGEVGMEILRRFVAL